VETKYLTRRVFARTAVALAAVPSTIQPAAACRYTLAFSPCAPCHPEQWVFAAIIAPHVPQFLVIRPDAGGRIDNLADHWAADHAVYELRRYASGAPPLLDAFRRHGIQPVFHGTCGGEGERAVYLFGFDSLERRARAWDDFAAGAFSPRGFGYDVSFYRRYDYTTPRTRNASSISASNCWRVTSNLSPESGRSSAVSGLPYSKWFGVFTP
jgi:hypothetical protein